MSSSIGSSKRVLLVITLVGINLIFTIQSLSLATPSLDFSENVPKVEAHSISLAEGAITAKAEIPQATKKVAKPVLQVKAVDKVEATAYTSAIEETDSTPFITASGTHVRSGVAASSYLPFGTKFKIPKIFGDKVFVVEDSMNKRYSGSKHIDIWLADKAEAFNFGRRTVQIEII